MAERRSIGNLVAPPQFFLFLALLFLCAWVATQFLADRALGILAGFDFAAAAFLVACVPLLRTREASAIQRHANANDANRGVLLIITAIVMLVLLLAVAAETMGQQPQPLTKVLVVVTLLIAWIFSNIIYALHYAHLAYRGSTGGVGGLKFPGTPKPVYWDFIYFAFTLGMTFQTSDVTIEDESIRRVVIFHATAAFVFNIGVLAFTINVLGSS